MDTTLAAPSQRALAPSRPRPTWLAPALRVSLFGLWFTATALGAIGLGAHVATPGLDRGGIAAWPADSAIPRGVDRPTLLCFVHPRCPCTVATLRELERALARAPRADVRVIFVDDPDGALEATPSWSLAARLPGARRLRDPGGHEARRFGATTSGLVMLFDERGALRFRGGVTPGRGHEGPSQGADSLQAALADRGAPMRWSRVFGCGLVDR